MNDSASDVLEKSCVLSMTNKSQRMLEIFLLIIAVALGCLLHEMAGYKMIVLNLYYLPVVLGGFFLGRYRGGILTLFCVISASLVASLDLEGFAAMNSPIVIGLAIIMWGAVLGLTSMLVGTLSDERSARIVELHEAYVGVVEVLSSYLQSANPRLGSRSNRVADLSQKVAIQLKLTPKDIDDIRVAALLHDMENIEITARVIRKAMGNLEEEQARSQQHTFYGTDLVHSLGSVLTGALPLLLHQSEANRQPSLSDDNSPAAEPSLGAKIIRVARGYVALTEGDWGAPGASPAEAIDELRSGTGTDYDPAVLDALERTIVKRHEQRVEEPQLVT